MYIAPPEVAELSEKVQSFRMSVEEMPLPIPPPSRAELSEKVQSVMVTEDDQLPKRVRTAFEKGPIEGEEISDETFAWAKRRYYELMGWHPDTAEPGDECLERLQLKGLMALEPPGLA